MRGYGVGGNEKGHAALTKRPNKGNADETAARAGQTRRAAERRESTLQQMRDTSSERLALSETAEEREARLQRLTDRLDLRVPRRGRPGCNR